MRQSSLPKTTALPLLLALCGTLALLVLLAAPAAEATTITAFAVDFSAGEGMLFSGAVATFEDDNSAAAPGDFTATIDWGDGTPTTAGAIGSSSAAFVVTGTHTYADEGTFTATVTIADMPPGTGTATATDTATITESDSLTGTPLSFTALAGAAFTGTVATFSDTFTGNAASDFTATIDWGDATVTAGTVTGGGASYSVSGTHTYASAGTFTVMVTLSDDKPGTATATVSSTAHVGAGAGLTAFPQTFAATEGTAFNGTVATFTDGRNGAVVTDFSATITWGDGTMTAGTIASSGGGVFSVSGTHTYGDEGSFSVPVQVTDNVSMTSANATSTANVAEGDVLTPHPVTITPAAGIPFTGTVATFTDTFTGNVPGDFTATIDWGDGNTTAGTVSGGGGTFAVSGTHTYAASGPFTVKVTLSDDPPGTAAATAASTANVQTAPVAAIPALDWRGLVALTLALAAAALAVLRRS